MNEGLGELRVSKTLFYTGDEENKCHACMSIYLTTTDQSRMRNAYPALGWQRGRWRNRHLTK